MKILIPLNDVWINSNPFVGILNKEFEKYQDVEIITGVANFWYSNSKIDIIHIYWSQCLLQDEFCEKSLDDLREKIIDFKNNGTRIVSTCLNLVAHYSENSKINKSYDLVYSMSDLIIHLADYSLELFKNKFPKIKGVIIEHHVYNTLYNFIPSREDSCKKLHLNSCDHYILSFGTYRSREERDFVIKVAQRVCRKTGYKFLIPTFFRKYGNENFKAKFRDSLYKLILLFHPYIKYGSDYVDDLLPYYYAVSDISFIQRIKILNSGNVPMGLFWGHVVVGTEGGCVGDILRKLGNPTFNHNKLETVVSAVVKAINLVHEDKGLSNRDYVFKNCTVELTVQKIYNCYKAV